MNRDEILARLKQQASEIESPEDQDASLDKNDIQVIIATVLLEQSTKKERSGLVPCVIAIITILIVTILLLRVGDIDFEAQAITKTVSVKTEAETLLPPEGLLVNSLELYGELKISRDGRESIERNIRINGPDNMLILLSEIKVRSPSTISIGLGSDDKVEMSFRDTVARIEVSIPEKKCIEVNKICDPGDGRITIHSSASSLLAKFSPLRKNAQILKSRIPITGASFSNKVNYVRGSVPFSIENSGLISGALYFPSLSRKERTLIEGEVISFSNFSGLLNSVRLDGTSFKIVMEGRAKDIEPLKFKNGLKTLKPRYLDVLISEQNHLWSAWALIVYLFTTVWGLVRWFRKN